MMQAQAITVVLNGYGFDGLPVGHRAMAESEANRAFAEITCRHELLALAEAAHHGPIELARMLRLTEHGDYSRWARRPLAAFFAHLYGKDCVPTDPYAQSYCYAFQSILPALRSLH